nr:alpha/beta hydrolase-fold protein [uncultured Arsenicibacter sp.]
MRYNKTFPQKHGLTTITPSALYRQVLTLLFTLSLSVVLADSPYQWKIKVSVSPEMQKAYLKGGRLLLHVTSQREREPRNRSEITIGITPENWDGTRAIVIDTRARNLRTSGLDKPLEKPDAKYCFQVVYKQNPDDGQENVPGNLYSNIDSVQLSKKLSLSLTLTTLIQPVPVMDHKLVKLVTIQSKLLTAFRGRPSQLKAAVLLPSGYYDNPAKTYPICYRIPGLNGRYTAVNTVFGNKEFADWWLSGQAPQVIYVFLDSQGPYGDTYQVDSENNGPCGRALTEELIPEIERQFRYNPASKKRFLTGNSTGGWVSLGLQIFYPDFFDGTWSYSPDPVDFEHYGLINIYSDKTIFYNRYGYLQPGRRTTNGEPTFSMKDWIANENVAGRTNNYLISGGQFGAYNAVFGPKGADGLPSLMFNPDTGEIDHAIAQQWEKYDLKKVLERNWPTLGPKLQGKIWIWMGDMDGLYSNVATRYLEKMLSKTENPKSDAKIRFTAMAGHGQEWSDKAVLTMIAEKTK